MAVQREGDPDNLAAPTGELQDIRTPSLIGTAGYDGAIMDTRGTPPGMPGQEKPVLLHQPVDPLGIDGIEAGGSPLALEERGDPPVSIGRTPIHQAPDIGGELCVAGAGLWTALRPVIFPPMHRTELGVAGEPEAVEPIQPT